MTRVRPRPAESYRTTTAPGTRSCVALSVNAPRMRWAWAGDVAAATTRTSPATRLRTATGETANAVDQTADFISAGVTAASHANEAVGHESEPIDDRGRVEIAIRDEDAFFRKRDCDVIGGVAAKRERQRRRTWRSGTRPIERDAIDGLERAPQSRE